MKNPDPNPITKPGQTQTTGILIENVYESRVVPYDGVAVQMSLLFVTARPTFWARASKIAAAHLQSLVGARPLRPEREVISNPEAWFIKVVYTLFLCSHFLDSYLGYLSKNLTPSLAFVVIKRLNFDPNLGLKFFELSRVGLSVNHGVWTYNFLLRSLCQMGLQDSAKLVLDYMRCDGYSPGESVVVLLVTSYAQMGKVDVVERILDEAGCGEVRLSNVVYNRLFSVLVKQNLVDEAVCLFKKYMGSHCRPDSWMFNILIQGLCKIGGIDRAFAIFGDMGRFGCTPAVVTYNMLIGGLCKANDVDRGCSLLRELQLSRKFPPDVITYMSVISGYCKLGRMGEASALFHEMTDSGVSPTTVTYNALIDGFGKAGDMSSAVAMYDKMLFHGYHGDVFTFTSLIDGCCLSWAPKQWVTAMA